MQRQTYRVNGLILEVYPSHESEHIAAVLLGTAQIGILREHTPTCLHVEAPGEVPGVENVAVAHGHDEQHRVESALLQLMTLLNVQTNARARQAHLSAPVSFRSVL